MVAIAHPLARTRIEVDPLLGRDIGGRFVLTQRLGSGETGVVYRAVQRSVGREVAVKILRTSCDPDLVGRFLSQARTVGRIGHPNLMEVIDAGFTGDGLLYQVTNYLAGRTLADAVAAEGRFDLDRLMRVAIQLCDALDAAHTRSVVHGDLRLSNVMLMPGDSVVVFDFGISPPGADHRGWVDPSGDLHALGLILHELASGRRFDTEWSTLPHLPRSLASLIHALVAPGAGHYRPQSARQVRAELIAMQKPPAPERSREANGLIHMAPRRPGRPAQPRRRGRGVIELLFGAAVGLGLGYSVTVLAAKAFGLG